LRKCRTPSTSSTEPIFTDSVSSALLVSPIRSADLIATVT